MARRLVARSDDWLIAVYASAQPAGVKRGLRTLINLIRLPTLLMLQGMKAEVYMYEDKEGLRVAYIGEGSWAPFLAHLLESEALEKVEKLAFWCIPAKWKIRKYTYETTTVDTVYQDFFHHMYLPYISSRYHGQAILAENEHLKQHFSRGVLLIVKREEEPVAGVICRGSGQTCHLRPAWGPGY
jgi:hypothetical protein